jgi:hypothetical protein
MKGENQARTQAMVPTRSKTRPTTVVSAERSLISMMMIAVKDITNYPMSSTAVFFSAIVVRPCIATAIRLKRSTAPQLILYSNGTSSVDAHKQVWIIQNMTLHDVVAVFDTLYGMGEDVAPDIFNLF